MQVAARPILSVSSLLSLMLAAITCLFGCGIGVVDECEPCDCVVEECEPCDPDGENGNGCTPDCEVLECGATDGCGQVCEPGSGCSCLPACNSLECGETDGCGQVCEPGSGCSCVPDCNSLECGETDGCGQVCEPGSGCSCVPDCNSLECGETDGCGQVCEPGSGCSCLPACNSLECGETDGCGQVCEPGSGCSCVPDCNSLECGETDGCGQVCEPGSGCTCSSDCHAWHPPGGPSRDPRPCGELDRCGDSCQPGSGCVLQSSDPPPGLSNVQEWFYTTPIAHWPVTITINSADISWLRPYSGEAEGSEGIVRVGVNYDSHNRIPLHHYCNGECNPNIHNVNLQIGILRYYQNTLIYGTVDYLRMGQFGKDVGVAHKWKFMPQSGETIWIVVSTLSRPPYSQGTVGPHGESYYERSHPFPVTVP